MREDTKRPRDTTMKIAKSLTLFALVLLLVAQVQPPALAKSWFRPLTLTNKQAKINVPAQYTLPQLTHFEAPTVADSAGAIDWRRFFSDPYLIKLIETALANNQEFTIFLQDIEIATNEVKAKQADYLPKVGIGAGAEKYRVPNYTRQGGLTELLERNEIRDEDADFNLGLNLSWEVDIWKKLRNTKDAARMRLMSQYEGRNFLISRLVTEIARTYYELMALDNVLTILDENIAIQTKAFLKMKLLKEYAKSNQLAVNRFEAQLLETKSQRYQTSQDIIEKENRLKFLSGLYDNTPIVRNSAKLMAMPVDDLQLGVPVELLENRPDIRQAEYAIEAAKLELKSVKANLYPNLSIKAGVGFSAFNPRFLFNPKSFVYNVLGDLMAPVINRQAILAQIQIADAYQSQAVLTYEQTLLQAYTDVLNQISKIKNLQQSFEIKQKEVYLLDNSVDIANTLFQYAKADYVEVLLTQEEKLSAQKELVELKKSLVASKVDLYRALGGGWK